MDKSKTNLGRAIQERKLADYEAFYRWSITERDKFWEYSIGKVGIQFQTPFRYVRDPKSDVTAPRWLSGSRLNIAESCFQADGNQIAIFFAREGGKLHHLSYSQLKGLCDRVSHGLSELGLKVGDAVAIAMTMTAESVAVYLGAVQAGMTVVSIADSFAPEEIQTRLRISNAKLIFTQDVIPRAGKTHPMYEKVVAAGATKIVVLPAGEKLSLSIRKEDIAWEAFLGADAPFPAVPCDPDFPSNILFSSGTTGDPKAIPWTHVTPIKCAVDAYYHHDVQPGNIVAWPTNLGWMMGPWLIYATLVNKGTIALYYGAPMGREFGEFIQNARVNILGLVPSIVKAWRAQKSMENLDWSAIKLFSSTGECSNSDDYEYLMSLANGAPVIEYCGGTEIGGGYVTGTLLQPAIASTFTTPALGIRFEILDGEVFIEPPSIGLSNSLLNQDHQAVYFKDTPKSSNGVPLRRHGDQMEQLPNGYYRALGRADDTMNLGGIKVSSAEIERVLSELAETKDIAAIGVNPKGGGPSHLVIYAVVADAATDKKSLIMKMNQVLRAKLNPLFKVEDLVIVGQLPRTASNKVMRRVLRKEYEARV